MNTETTNRQSMPRHGGGRRGRMTGEKARDFRGTMIKLIKYLSVYRNSILIVVLFAAISTVFTIIGPKILGQAITKLFEGSIAQLTGTGSIDFDAIGKILLTVAGLYLTCLLYTSPSPRDRTRSRMPSSA